ncbi:MAG TPA: histidine kinase [Acidobacteriota bacterium]|nr:histidine kinase [Acidobacteriota bacterium]
MSETRNRWSRVAIVFGFWTLAGIAYASHLYFYHMYWEHSNSWAETILESFSDFYTWAFLSLFILKLASRFRLKRGQIARSLLVLIPASFFFSFVQVAMHAAIDHFLLEGYEYIHEFSGYFVRTFHFGLLVYWTIVVIQNAIDYYKDQAIAASELQTQLAQAQLQALKMQIHPHFLFNTLNSISSLMHYDPKGADAMLCQLGELLRLSLSSDQYQEVSLQKELEFLDKYLAIEKIRFQDRLTVVMNIESDTLQAQIPNLILQPLVENSIRHGISDQRGPGKVEIDAERENGMLLVRVRDNGKGLPENGAEVAEGIGLKNTRARLEYLYGSHYRFEMRRTPESSGLEVTLAIPFHEDADN